MSKSYSKNIFAVFMAFVLVVGLCPFTNVQASAQPSSQSSSSQAAVQESIEGTSSETVEEAGSEASNKSAEGTNLGDEPAETQTSDESAAKEGLPQTSASSADSSSNDTAPGSPEQLSTLPASTKVDESEEGTAYAAGEVLVTMKGSAESAAATETLQQAQTVKTEAVTDENVVSQDTVVAEVTDGATVAQAIAELEADPDVEAVQPNYIYTLMDDDSAEATAAEEIQQSIAEIAPQSSVTTNDPLASYQWGLASAHVNEAWSLARCDGSVTVAVLDSGFDMTHEDLKSRYVSPKDIMDGDTNPSTDYLPSDNYYNHGTHVAGIIAAEADNGKGVVGCSYNANIMPIRVFSKTKATYSTTLVSAYEWVISHATTNNVRVVNMSLGSASPFKDAALEKVINKAKNESGILTVCAAGNTNLTSTPPPFGCWPAQYSNCLGVANLRIYNDVVSRSSTSNYAFIDGICAPGSDIYSTTFTSAYSYMSGTSMSSPAVAGIAALCFAAKSSATVDEVRTCLENTATDLGPVGKDNEYGYGEVNAYAAVISMLGITIKGQDIAETGSTATYSLSNTGITDAVWSVSDTSKATINATTGVLTPLSPGAVTVTAKSGLYSWTKEVTVWPGGIKDISAADVSELSSQPYSGSAYSPTPEVTYYGIPLVAGADYALSYANNTNVGTAQVTITGKGRFNGIKQVPFTITPRGISAASIASIPAEPYTGNAHAPTPVVTLAGKTLTAGTDYTVSYANNTNAGTAKVTITGKGNYTGTASGSFTISPMPIAAASVTGLSSATYTGSAITQNPTVKINDKTLTAGTDYTLSYANNINAGAAAKVIITGKGNYSGTKQVPFTINAKSIASAEISSIPPVAYTGSPCTPSPTVKVDGKTLSKGTDYTLSYANNVAVGTATVTVIGAGNYKDTRDSSFTITKQHLSRATISAIAPVTYTGSPCTPALVVKVDGATLIKGVDYTVSYANNTNAGTAKITVTGKGLYSGTKQASFTITPKNLSAASVSSLPTVAYTGKAWTPTPTVSVSGKTLAKGSDYTLSYANNVNPGSARVTVNGKGNYTGSKSVNFRIVDILSYTTHVQNIGWQNYVGSGTMAGTSGRSLRLEGIKIKTNASALGLSGGITYQTHVQDIGWQREVSNNAMSGTSGRCLRLEAIKIRLTGQLGVQYDVYYRVHAQDIGWMGWAKNGEAAGTAGYSKRLEGIQIVLVPKKSGSPANNFRGITSVDTHPCIDSSATNGKVSYNATMHIQNKGNTKFSTSGSKFLGTTGSALRVEALTITKFNAPTGTNLGVRYRTHIQNIGWESSWKSVGQTSGTSGRALRLEALQLELTGTDKGKYDIYYRTHIQNIGWTGWAKNGQQCGSAGYGYRMEAMQIVVVPKNGTAPGINSGYFYKR